MAEDYGRGIKGVHKDGPRNSVPAPKPPIPKRMQFEIRTNDQTPALGNRPSPNTNLVFSSDHFYLSEEEGTNKGAAFKTVNVYLK